MSAPLNTALKFCFPIRKMSDGTRFKPTPDPTVDAALYPDGSAIAGVALTWDATNLEYTYTLASGNVTLTGPYRIYILVTDAAAASMAYEAEWEVEAVPTSVTAAQVRTEMDANSTRLAEIATDVDGIAAIPTTPLLTTDSRLNNLDATISSRSTLNAAQVWAYGTRTLSSFGTLVADIATAVWGATTRTLTAFGFSILSPILVVSPVQVDAGRTIKMAKGADYTVASGQPVQFKFSGLSSFVGGSCVLTLPKADGTTTLITGTIVGTDTARFDVSKTVTALLADGRYSVQVTLSNASVLLPVIGGVVIYER